MKKKVTKVDNHLIIASYILSRARSYFYDLYYTIKSQLGQKALSCIYYDTDSYVLHWYTSDYLNDLKKLKYNEEYIMDWSFLPDTTEFASFDRSNKNIPGKLKSETKHHRILEIVVLKKKMYAVRLDGAPDKIRGKGIPKPFLKGIKFNVYKEILQKGTLKKVKVQMLKSIRMQIYHIQQERIALTHLSESRFLLGDGSFGSLPFGHKDIPEGERESWSLLRFVSE